MGWGRAIAGPMVLAPVYALLRFFSATRVSAEQLGFVTTVQMSAALVRAAEEQPTSVRMVEMPAIRAVGEE